MRTPSVTRTFRATKITGLFVDITTKETSTKDITIPRTYKSEKDILKAIAKSKMFDGNERLVTVLAFEPVTAKYVMSETDFIAHAKAVNETTK